MSRRAPVSVNSFGEGSAGMVVPVAPAPPATSVVLPAPPADVPPAAPPVGAGPLPIAPVPLASPAPPAVLPDPSETAGPAALPGPVPAAGAGFFGQPVRRIAAPKRPTITNAIRQGFRVIPRSFLR